MVAYAPKTSFSNTMPAFDVVTAYTTHVCNASCGNSYKEEFLLTVKFLVFKSV